MNRSVPAEANRPEISVIVPLKNEAETLEELVDQVTEALDQCKRSFEIIFIDDGSTDTSVERLEWLCAQYPKVVRAIFFRRNFGKAKALQAGFDRAKGDLFLTLDADLQDVPSEITKLLSEIDKGVDLVSGWKVNRQDPASKRIPSKLFNWVVSATFGLKLHDFNCGFKCYRRQVIEDISLYGELHRFVPVLAHAHGFRVSEVPVTHRPREHGESKYGLGRIPKGFFDLLTVLLTTRYFERPLHFFGAIGLSLFALGVAVLGYISLGWLFGVPIAGRPLFFLGILMVVVGGQVISTGLLAELFISARSGAQAKYAIRKTTNL